MGVLWFGAVVTGLSLVARYDNTPGPAADAPEVWPAPSGVTLDPDRPTLVMLAHPRCACTRASVTELAEVMARAAHRPKAYVVFIKPGGVAARWEQTDLWKSAAEIPGVTVLRDDGGDEARRFGASTSGQTLVYAPDGRLLFSGGATGARGHAGNNHGRAALLAILSGEQPDRTSTPVFGCSLFGTHDELAAAAVTAVADGPQSK
jgi:hypothetical protein